MLKLVSVILGVGLIFCSTATEKLCRLKWSAENRNSAEVLWVNMDKSVERFTAMNETLSFYLLNHRRVPATIPEHLVFPKGFLFASECHATPEKFLSLYGKRLKLIQEKKAINHTSVLVASHCGKFKNNFDFGSLSNTISHLLAIYRAVFEGNEKVDYAIIMEDDVRFPYEINLSALIQSAPKNFAILQLVTNNPLGVNYLWTNHFWNSSQLWVQRKEFDSYWSSAAFLIKKSIFVGVIDKLVTKLYHNIYSVRIEAVDRVNCMSRTHCQCSNMTLPKLPCVLSPHGYEADSFIYNILYGYTYVTTIPLILPLTEAMRSTQHQEQVKKQERAFNFAKDFLEDMISEKDPLVNKLWNLYCSK